MENIAFLCTVIHKNGKEWAKKTKFLLNETVFGKINILY